MPAAIDREVDNTHRRSRCCAAVVAGLATRLYKIPETFSAQWRRYTPEPAARRFVDENQEAPGRGHPRSGDRGPDRRFCGGLKGRIDGADRCKTAVPAWVCRGPDRRSI